MIDDKLIESLAQKYEFNAKTFGDMVIVDTKTDSFKIEFNPTLKNKAPIDIYHLSSSKNKMHYHFQCFCFSFEEAFKYMFDHQNKYKFCKNKKYNFAI